MLRKICESLTSAKYRLLDFKLKGLISKKDLNVFPYFHYLRGDVKKSTICLEVLIFSKSSTAFDAKTSYQLPLLKLNLLSNYPLILNSLG